MEKWKKTKVVGVFKKSCIHRFFRQLQYEDGTKDEKNFKEEIKDWMDNCKVDQELDEPLEAFPVKVLSKTEHEREDVKKAKLAEIDILRNPSQNLNLKLRLGKSY